MSDQLLSTSIKWLAGAFAEAGAGRPLIIEAPVAATFALALDMAGARLEEMDEMVSSDDRLRHELAIARAEIAHLELRLRCAETLAAGGSAAPGPGRPIEPSAASLATTRACFERDRAQRSPYAPMVKGREESRHRTAEIIDLTEELGREKRTARHPAPTDGGAA